MDYSKYLDVGRMPARAVTWADAPADVKQAVPANPDKCLMAFVLGVGSRWHVPDYRYGPSPTEDYAHISSARLEKMTQTNYAGDEAGYQRLLAELRTSATDTTACVLSRVYSCAPLPLKVTPFLAGLMDTALGNLRRAHDAAKGTAGVGAGAGGNFTYAAVHWRRGDKCGANGSRAVQVDPG